MIKGLMSWLRRAGSREDGNATIEFVILFPIFMVLTLTAIEVGILSLRQVMLERSVDLTVRSLRVGALDDPTFQQVKDDICDSAFLIPNCDTDLHLELTPVSTSTWQVPTGTVTCVDRTSEVDPAVNFNSGKRNELMLMRACLVFDPLFPSWGIAPRLPLDPSGGYRLVASTAFVNEP